MMRANSLASGALRYNYDSHLFPPLSRQRQKPISTLPSHHNSLTFFAVAYVYYPNNEALQTVYFVMRGGQKMKWRVYVMLMGLNCIL